MSLLRSTQLSVDPDCCSGHTRSSQQQKQLGLPHPDPPVIFCLGSRAFTDFMRKGVARDFFCEDCSSQHIPSPQHSVPSGQHHVGQQM